MAGVAINVSVGDQAVQALFEQLQTLGPSVVVDGLDDIGAGIASETQGRFARSEGPDGKKWKDLAPATKLSRLGSRKSSRTKRGNFTAAAQRKLDNMRPLIHRGHLRDSITHNVLGGGTGVEVGTNLVQGAIHQFGGPAGRGGRVQIPARPYLGLNAGDELEIGRTLLDHVEAALR